MSDKQPEALRLADYCHGLAAEIDHTHFTDDLYASANELRRLHAQRDELLEALKALTDMGRIPPTGLAFSKARAAIAKAEASK